MNPTGMRAAKARSKSELANRKRSGASGKPSPDLSSMARADPGIPAVFPFAMPFPAFPPLSGRVY